jgi:hypothetical protein
LQRGDLGGIDIDASDAIARSGETGARNQTDVSRADHRDVHE